ncbi:MAG: type III effector [endosymbiont of Galathealinum brachiosum]|uniref:Type III effector n=1 Tax=endosymbiont of Galathealinum brachiosum TaxID=2200906 RepID=A0A370DDR5_9GAMM|nr:MAG: type III effector [endosymbiont of Galathealinum brachiosum]
MKNFLLQITSNPENNSFENTITTIDQNYDFSPCEFNNGDLLNAENQNNGSCKIFAFARLQNLTEPQTLHCFGDYYRKDVLENPDNTDHQNIRNFIKTGWSGISFDSNPLTEK